MISRMQERYRKEVVPALMKHFGRTNPMSVPKVAKVIVNIGMGEASQNVKLLDVAGFVHVPQSWEKTVVISHYYINAHILNSTSMPTVCCVQPRLSHTY